VCVCVCSSACVRVLLVVESPQRSAKQKQLSRLKGKWSDRCDVWLFMGRKPVSSQADECGPRLLTSHNEGPPKQPGALKPKD